MPQHGSGSRQSVARCRTTLPQKQNRTQVRAAPYVVPHCRAYPTTDVACWPIATLGAVQRYVRFRGVHRKCPLSPLLDITTTPTFPSQQQFLSGIQQRPRQFRSLAGGGARPDQSINGHAQRTGHLDETSHAANLIDVCQAPREFASQAHSE